MLLPTLVLLLMEKLGVQPPQLSARLLALLPLLLLAFSVLLFYLSGCFPAAFTGAGNSEPVPYYSIPFLGGLSSMAHDHILPPQPELGCYVIREVHQAERTAS